MEYFYRYLLWWESSSRCTRSAFGNIFNKFPMKQHSFTFSYIQTGDYCNCSYCFTAVVLEVNSVWSCERRVHVSIYASSARCLLVMLIIQVIIYRVPNYSQPDFLIPSIFNTYFTKNYVASVWDVFLNIYFIVDPHNKAQVYQILFTCSQTISMKNLNGKQNLTPEKSIYSYLVKFYRTTDTIYVEYTGLFHVSLLCPCVSAAAILWNESCAGIRPLII